MRNTLLSLLLSASLPALAQQPTPIDTSATATAAPTARTYPWYRPRHLIVQTAGGIGMVAAGVGYTFLHDKVEADVLAGYVPEKYAGSALGIATVKLLYTPFSVPLGQKFQLRPLTVGGYLSHTSGLINPAHKDQYPPGYYWFSSTTRYGALLGSRISFLVPSKRNVEPHRLSAYYELGTNDLYTISYFLNHRALSLPDILVLGLGLKYDF